MYHMTLLNLQGILKWNLYIIHCQIDTFRNIIMGGSIMKKITAIALCLALGISTPVFADVVNDLKAAEEVFGIDNSDKTAIERVGILEEQLGITDAEGTLSDRLGRIENELGMSGEAETESVTENVEETEVTGESLVNAPADDFVMERLSLIGTITDMAPVTEDHDPNGQLGKQGGYIGCIYFRDSQVDHAANYIPEDDVIEAGTNGGGAIEIFATKEEATVREAYLASFDGTGFSSGSHKIVGTCLVRTSTYLTASQQNTLTDQIEQVLTAEDPTTLEFSQPNAQSAQEVETEAEDNSGFELYSQDGYTITAMDYEENDPIMGNILKLRIQNLTHHNVTFSDSGSYVNGSMMMLGAYFQIASGKTQTNDLYIDKKSLKDAGIDKIEDITLNFDVFDSDSYGTLTNIGPLSITIDENGNIANKVVYRDAATIQEVQSLLNAAGYDCGSADGIAGKKTNDMILQYERDHGLREDTDITDELLAALRG